MNKNKTELLRKYKLAKDAKCGELVSCPSCEKPFNKKRKHQAFCGSRYNTICKDNYYNNVTPNKRNNKTRISPASAAYKERTFSSRESYPFWLGEGDGWDFKDED